MRDSGLNISYAILADAISEKQASFCNAFDHCFTVGTCEDLIPTADVMCILIEIISIAQ